MRITTEERRQLVLADEMSEMIALGWTLETFDHDFDNCDCDGAWSPEEKETCREIFRYLWQDLIDDGVIDDGVIDDGIINERRI